ncbi:hypothetical protein HQ400_07735 [Aeromonas jandaei]|nr:hypothetical protein HQ400_07735 [Aeromonas jandaei]
MQGTVAKKKKEGRDASKSFAQVELFYDVRSELLAIKIEDELVALYQTEYSYHIDRVFDRVFEQIENHNN